VQTKKQSTVFRLISVGSTKKVPFSQGSNKNQAKQQKIVLPSSEPNRSPVLELLSSFFISASINLNP